MNPFLKIAWGLGSTDSSRILGVLVTGEGVRIGTSAWGSAYLCTISVPSTFGRSAVISTRLSRGDNFGFSLAAPIYLGKIG